MTSPPNPTTPLPALLALIGLVAVTLSILIGGTALQPAVIGLRRDEETRVEGRDWPRQLIDPSGTRQTLAEPPTRILSATLASDEILLDLVGPERLIGLTTFVDDPITSNVADRAPSAELVPRLASAEVETTLAMQPDLVFVASFNRAETVRLLMASGIPVVRFGSFEDFEDIRRHLRTTGEALGEEQRAATILQSMDARLTAVVRAVEGVERPRVLYLNGGYTSGTATIVDEMIALAGGRNVASEAELRGTVLLGGEIAIGLQPDVVMLTSYSDDPSMDPVAAFIADPLWKDAPAVRHGRVYAVPAALTSTVSHHAASGVEYMAKLLHPGVFPK